MAETPFVAPTPLPFVAPTPVTGVGGGGNGNGGNGGGGSSSGGSNSSNSSPGGSSSGGDSPVITGDTYIRKLKFIINSRLNDEHNTLNNSNAFINPDQPIFNFIPANATNLSVIEKKKLTLSDLRFHRANVQDENKNTKLFYLVENTNSNLITHFIDHNDASKVYPELELDLLDGKIPIYDIVKVFNLLAEDPDGITGQLFNLYNNICQRFPDANGLQYHANNIRSGQSTLKDTFDSFVKSNEFKDKIIITDSVISDSVHSSETVFKGSYEDIMVEINKTLFEPWYKECGIDLDGTFR